MTEPVYAAVAQEYLAAGFAPIPLPPRQKVPPESGWTGYGGNYPTAGKVEEWCAEHPDGNVALRLPYDVVGIDVDHHDDKHGLDTLRELEERLGGLPATVMSTSRDNGAGIRLYRVPNRTHLRAMGSDIDTLTWYHRYVVAAPSIHPDTGATYRWIDQASGEILNRAPRIDELPDLPWAWLAEFTDTGEHSDPAKVATDAEVEAFCAAHEAEPIDSWLEYLPRLIQRTQDGDDDHQGKCRHDTLVSVAAQAMREAAAGAYPASTAIEVLREWWLRVMDDPTRHGAEFSNAIAWAVAQVTTEPDKVDAIRARVEESRTRSERYLEPFVASAAELDGGDAVAALVERAGVVEWSTFWNEPPAEHEWIIPDLFPVGRAVSIYAQAKQGKSSVILAAIAAVVTGRPVFGNGAVQRRRVLYLDYEMTRDDLRDRLEEFGYDDSADLDYLRYALLPSLRPLDTPEGAAELVALARHLEVEVVVIDTFGRAVDGAEDDNDTVRDYYRYTGQALKRAGIACLRVDHAGKNLKRGQRGGSSKDDDLDLVWELTRTGTDIRLRRTHSRISWAPDEVRLTRVEVGGVVEFRDQAPRSIDPNVLEVVGLLDDLGLPNDATNVQSREALKANGTGRSNGRVSAAVSIRKKRGNGAREVGERLGERSELVRGTPTGNERGMSPIPIGARGTPTGNAEESSTRAWGTSDLPQGRSEGPHQPEPTDLLTLDHEEWII